MGFSYLVSLGDMLDVDFGDMIDYLGGERDVSSIVMYVESLSRFRKFMSAARAVSRVKPIVVLKAGRTKAGALAADVLSDYGYDPVPLRDETLKKIDAILPPYWSRRNPIDMLGDATPEDYQKVVDICLAAKEVNGILIISAPQALTDTSRIAAHLIDIVKNKPLPIFTSWVGGAVVQKARDIFNQAGIPTFDTPERAVRAFMDLYRNSQNIKMLQEIPSRLSKRLEFDRDSGRRTVLAALNRHEPLLNETESKALLSAYGIPVNLIKTASSAEEAVEKACSVGFPVALKINSRDITHKSDAKAVFLNLSDEYAVRNAFLQAIQNAKAYKPEAKIDSVSIQRMVPPKDYELIVGIKKVRGVNEYELSLDLLKT